MAQGAMRERSTPSTATAAVSRQPELPDGVEGCRGGDAAFLVLDDEESVSGVRTAMLQAAYDASLATIPDGALKENGIAVGTMAAEAMLAEGHDGRTFIRCAFGSGAAGVWEPLAGATGPMCDPSPWVANAVPFMVKSPSQFRTAGPPRWRVLPTRTSSTRPRRSAPSTV